MDPVWRSIYGVNLHVTVSPPEIIAYFQHLFDPGAVIEPAASDISLHVRLASNVVLPSGPSIRGVLVHSRGDLTYRVDEQRLSIRVGSRAVFHTDCARHSVHGQITQALLDDVPLLANVALNALAPLLRRRGVFPVHAFGVVRRRRAVLLVGKSGSGKTTAGLALVRAGWGYLSNDHPGLREARRGIDVLCGREQVNVDSAAADFFPELRTLFRQNGHTRQSFDINAVYGDVLREKAPLHLLLFPAVTAAERCRLENLSRGQALFELLSEGVDAWDRALVGENFSVLATLAETVPAYRLLLGRDFENLPDLIGDLLLDG